MTAPTGAANALVVGSRASQDSKHAGSAVDEDTCALFVAIERVTCSTPSCGGPPVVGSNRMLAGIGPPGAPTTNTGVAGAEDQTAPSAPGLCVELPSLQLPPDFTQRVRLLLANTLLHSLSGCRLRMIAATAQCWQGMAQGSTLETLVGLGAPRAWRGS